MTVVGLALSAFIVACGDDDDNVTPPPGTDAGNTSSSSSSGSPNTDSGTDSGPKPPPAKLQLVNAATDMGPNNPVGALRICYKIGPDDAHLSWAPLPPLPNRKSGTLPFPGLFVGTGGPVDGTGVDLSTLVIKPYLLSAASLEAHGLGSTVTAGNDKDCQSIIEADAGGPFAENKDYWVLPNVPANTFKVTESYLLVLTGCTGDSTKTAAECGGTAPSGTAGPGNLAINVFKVDNKTTVDPAKLGVQFVSVSPTLEGALAAQSGGTLHTRPAIMTDKANPATATLIGSVDGGAPGDVPPGTFTTLVQVSATPASSFVSPNPNVAPLGFSFTQVAQLTFGATADSSVYANGKAYTIVALGDPAADPDGGNGGAIFNTKFFHFLALPNDPAVNNYDPSK